ncbi:hypothetical protein LSS_02799 [Leptospira santarosai serovar Shermani str. LT 821]|uniref:Uncharacterized protein n=1 Tax=Leptospira santarosai serovar Shermani str. LT 821 TaxID=758847 RepID=K8Y5N6_9LEPT|nr:hypothetical protein LSS_02799 [Leptospira santarosai serovar Shermani str. LT 821]
MKMRRLDFSFSILEGSHYEKKVESLKNCTIDC